MHYTNKLGINLENGNTSFDEENLKEYVNLRLSLLGEPTFGDDQNHNFMNLAKPLISNFREILRKLDGKLCPADERINQTMISCFKNAKNSPLKFIPDKSLILDRYAMARVLSLPPNHDKFHSNIVDTFRTKEGILHNPKNDKRTTSGVFHIVDDGLPCPDDKKLVPIETFLYIVNEAINNAPDELLELPFTSNQKNKARTWTSLFLRPVVCPKVPNLSKEKRMEIRFFAPGNLVGNLDFVESIFSNAGNPYLFQNDCGLDPKYWTGHTGCIILAPHLIKCTKKQLGLPHFDNATDRQKRDGMCYKDENELYNDGKAFKICFRNSKGIIYTIIADNYFGYSKKEVKTQISYSANLYGDSEEEHSGGAIAYSSRDLGEDFRLENFLPNDTHTYKQACEILQDSFTYFEDGWAVSKDYENVILVNEKAYFSLTNQKISWSDDNGNEKTIRLSPKKTYLLPCGYKVMMTRPHKNRSWRLVGVVSESMLCHKPATVSGGGKSEISKDITDAIIHGHSFVADFKNDVLKVEEIINGSYGNRHKDPLHNHGESSRHILSEKRSLGSVVKLLSTSEDYTDEYNAWLDSIPFYIREFILSIKRFYKDSWNGDWKKYFSVDEINGEYGNMLKYKNKYILSSYLRIGFASDGSWRTFSLRKDFAPSVKLQVEDDITASCVVPANKLKYLDKNVRNKSLKFVENCEFRLFQRPDEAIKKGYDKQAEKDMSKDNNFISNYQALTKDDVQKIVDDVIEFDKFTSDMKENLLEFLKSDKFSYAVCSANPRLIDNEPSKNVRYLQNRDDLTNPEKFFIADLGAKLDRYIPLNEQVPNPVNAVISGRRNNPASAGIEPLCVHSPLHYLPLPELFMEYIASMTGKSPSTTGAGLEGALTKGPFNALDTITDLNNALVSFILTGYNTWISAAGWVGPKYRVDHDISLLIPEIWSRLKPEELDTNYLIEKGMLEKCEDISYNGNIIKSSYLGYRITKEFVIILFGRIFSNPSSIFTDDMLRPEQQDIDTFARSMNNILDAYKRASCMYFNDGSIKGACPPLKALLHIMKDGSFEGKTINDPQIRDLFTYENLINSDWYAERLICQSENRISQLQKSKAYIQTFIDKSNYQDLNSELKEKLKTVETELKTTKGLQYMRSLSGHLGLDPYLFE